MSRFEQPHARPASFSQRIGLVAILAGLGLAGCSDKRELPAAPERPSYSTLDAGERASLQDIPQLAAERERLSHGITPAVGGLRKVLEGYNARLVSEGPSGIDAWMRETRYQTVDLNRTLSKAADAVSESVQGESFRGAVPQLSTVARQLEAAKAFVEGAPKLEDWVKLEGAPGEAPAYVALTGAYTGLLDLNRALEFDEREMRPGLIAARYVALLDQFQSVGNELNHILAGVDKNGSSWFEQFPEEAKGAKSTIQRTIEQTEASAQSTELAAIRTELEQFASMLKDVLTTCGDGAAISKYYDVTPRRESSGVTIVEQAQAFAEALRKDFILELASIGVQSNGASVPLAGTNQATTTHSSSGMNNLLLWYLIMRNNGGYSAHALTPGGYRGYSDTQRFYSSDGYTRFGAAADRALEKTSADSSIRNQAGKARVEAQRAAANRSNPSGGRSSTGGPRGGFGSSAKPGGG